MKKGQISVFLIAGVILLLGIGLFLLARPGIEKPRVNFDQETLQVYLRECSLETSRKGVIELALKGGYNQPPQPLIEQKEYRIPYYYENQNLAPDRTRLEQEFSEYISKNIQKCATFKEFRQLGAQVTAGTPTVKVTITKQKIISEISWAVKATLGEQHANIEAINTEYETLYGLSHEISLSLTKKVEEEPAYKDYSHISSQPQAVTLIPLDSLNDIYLITGKDYNYLFAVRYG